MKSISKGAEKNTPYLRSHIINLFINSISLGVICHRCISSSWSFVNSILLPSSNSILSNSSLETPTSISCFNTYLIRPQSPPFLSLSRSRIVYYGISSCFSSRQKWLTCRPPKGTIDRKLLSTGTFIA